ncbi:hypothetical protein OG389_22220 [Streptomyces sp. NBC_00435]|uniref:hypothetical protein n=1 Tax=Streptomyces sp. NBC_00435 TaxID=2903649 RepID=UPI002E233AD4
MTNGAGSDGRGNGQAGNRQMEHDQAAHGSVAHGNAAHGNAAHGPSDAGRTVPAQAGRAQAVPAPPNPAPDPLGLGKPVETVPCPHCGAPTTVLIGRALETSGCTHFAEGTVFALVAGAAGKYYAEDKGWPWLTAVGVLAGVLIFAVTIWVIRDANRTAARARVAVDRARAKGVTATHYCGACWEASAPGAPAST